MKKIKKIIAIVSSFAMICSSTVAFADAMLNANKANYDFFVEPATITQGTTEFTVNMGVYDITDAAKTIDFPMAGNSTANIYASLDAAAINAGIKSTEISTPLSASVDYSSVHDESPEYLSQFCIDFVFDQAAVKLNKNAPMATVKFSVPADIAPGTYKLTFNADKWDGITLSDGSAGQAAELDLAGNSYDFVTVTAPGPQGPTVTEGATANGITTYTFENVENNSVMKGQKVLMTETAKTGSTITANTRFKVTYEGQSPRYFGSDIWEKLAQGAGSISVGSVKFGLIVDEDEDASKFTFEIVEI